MARFDRGVKHYTVALVPINYPENEVTCRYCPLLKFRIVAGEAAAVCGSTGEIIKNIDKPDDCPAVIQEVKNET